MDRRVDLINENVDLDVRIAEVDEPHLVAHRLADSTPAALRRPRPTWNDAALPASITELSRHDCLVLRDRNQAFGVWRLIGPHGPEKVKVMGRLSSNNAEIVRGWGNDGHGIVLQARWGRGRGSSGRAAAARPSRLHATGVHLGRAAPCA